MKLKSLASDTMLQMMASENIVEGFASNLKKKLAGAALPLVATALLVGATGLAHAGEADRERNVMLGVGAVGGLLLDGVKPDNLPPECAHIRGISGARVGGGTAAGAVLFNQMGGGNGKKVATVVGGLLVGNAMAGKEQQRIEAECAKVIQQNQERGYRNGNGYNQTYYGHPEAQQVRVPQYQNSARANGPILYEQKLPNGRSYMVTSVDSPGLAALQGRGVGQNDPMTDPIVHKALFSATEKLEKSYENLNKYATTYYQMMHGGESTEDKLGRYAVSQQDVQMSYQAQQEKRRQLTIANANFQQAYSDYAIARGNAARIYDNAAVDGFNLTAYAKALEFISPPESAQLAADGR